ncbi:bifunctional phosphoribosyl-AMP cyclohydrolase/phosphoribosyl-ATP diphosphatase HisIE [Helicobacter cappadocius]|uniref:Histidine biosynthesis bifunctional protein HisIE n=1 Tax=Helicobacter cappadocius TaxID=3063998 RepID=A0AA90T589_9HELI|nr:MULTISPECIES: bifunctional phosphoribosyl-AMP cyclohydrolase/phosphoribosyl-ATP diphosphatase HisIE [unclassified Helicobacter]MDO7253244.1 bifunctional phosphoribosyl-AMP cyclohydrolase/phosphoribosyl-ATP diphosphatase HisIE [Helicobacter sp. faydin-H75]MDP2539168.1 bifunctional phosphoribosyl-AMP cyclohydrolase/phosphoribosyl-ATP diphosphatase HisIE [Helicobacter sp. faydin-H76]
MTQAQIQEITAKLDWGKSPLIPVVVQNFEDNSVLMLGFMNQDALRLSFETGFLHYFSRTKNRIWKKGEQSGHTQKIIEIFLDCDNDTLLAKVIQKGVVCHTGTQSCFFKKIDIQDSSISSIYESQDINEKYNFIDILYHTLQDKKTQSPQTSYTASLYAKGDNEICKKIIEEAGELTFALKDNEKKQIIYECSDLIYHILVALSYKNIDPDLIITELKRRSGMSGIDEKNSRKL